MLIFKWSRFTTLLKPIIILCLLFLACAKVPDDIVLYFQDDLEVMQRSAGKRQKIYVLKQEDQKAIYPLAYDPVNKIIAISTITRMLSGTTYGSAKIIMIDPNTHKILREIRTGMDSIEGLSFDREGKRLAIIVKKYKSKPRSLYVLDIDKESFQFITEYTEGELLYVSWGKGDEIYLSYKEGEKWLVGSINAQKGSTINKIAEGASISASDIRDAFVYKDMAGNVIYKEKGGIAKKLPIPSKFRSKGALSTVKFVHGSDDIIVGLFGIQWDNLYLLRAPYTDSQKILGERAQFLSFDAVAVK